MNELRDSFRKEYSLTRTESEKCELLFLWFQRNSEAGKSLSGEDFDRRYKYLFGEFPGFYTWGPFYRDHGFVGLRRAVCEYASVED